MTIDTGRMPNSLYNDPQNVLHASGVVASNQSSESVITNEAPIRTKKLSLSVYH